MCHVFFFLRLLSSRINQNQPAALRPILGQTSGDPSDVIPVVEEEEEAEVQVSRLCRTAVCFPLENERLLEPENGGPEWKRRNMDIQTTDF